MKPGQQLELRAGCGTRSASLEHAHEHPAAVVVPARDMELAAAVGAKSFFEPATCGCIHREISSYAIGIRGANLSRGACESKNLGSAASPRPARGLFGPWPGTSSVASGTST
jgi:hypothetical protein